MEIVADYVEVNHEAGTVGTSGCEKVADALSGHINSLFQFQSSGKKPEDKGHTRTAQEPAGGDPGSLAALDAQMMNQRRESGIGSALSAMDWREYPCRTSGNEGVPLQ
jgi:hypothetical protein